MADKKSIGEKEKGLNFMQRLLQNDNARKIIVVVGVVAILVIFLSSFFGGNKKQTTNTETVQQTSASCLLYTSLKDERKELADKFWETAEEGQEYKGVVKSDRKSVV